MFRFIAWTWAPNDPRQAKRSAQLEEQVRQQLPQWRKVLSREGLIVYLLGPSRFAQVLPDDEGVVLGTAFARGAAESSVCERAVGRHLVENYWGQYVAFLFDASEQKSTVLRDPSGAIPCLCTQVDSLRIYLSDINDLVQLNVREFAVNWDFVRERLVMPWRIEARETGLIDVTNLAAGECESSRGGTIERRFCWNPFDFASDPIDRIDAAVEALRAAVMTSIHTWAAQHRVILHSLSGGFDSSLVLACLASCPSMPEVESVTYYSPNRDDERDFARAMAAHANSHLHECAWSTDVDLRSFLSVTRSASPTMYLQWLELGQSQAQAASELGATAIFGGHGGDQLFVQRCLNRTAADYVHDRGLTPGLWAVCLGAAVKENISVWSVLTEAISFRFRPSAIDLRMEALSHRNLLTEDAVRTSNAHRFAHPWFSVARSVGPAKFDQIHSLTTPIEFYDPFGDRLSIERIYPLMSQPLIEACLRIPTYVLAKDGEDRALARKAFEQELPSLIRKRHEKGRLDEHIKEIYLNNLSAIREILLDGELVRRGLLDREKVEQALTRRPSAGVGGLVEVMDHLSTEAWLHSWSASRATSHTALPYSDPDLRDRSTRSHTSRQ
jgi:asparagine synthase (glutamine-hydrolysing)